MPVSLADRLGASRIFVVGADFSYPRGKPYARGTWLFDHFGCSSRRLSPLEGSLYSLIFSTGEPLRERVGDALRYTTHLQMGYKRSLERLAVGAAAGISAAAGPGLSLDLGPGLPEQPEDAGMVRGERNPGALPSRGAPGRSSCDGSPASWALFQVPGCPWHAGSPRSRRKSTRCGPLSCPLLQPFSGIRAREGHRIQEQAPAVSLPRAVAAGLDSARSWMAMRISRVLSEDDARVADE